MFIKTNEIVEYKSKLKIFTVKNITYKIFKNILEHFGKSQQFYVKTRKIKFDFICKLMQLNYLLFLI